MKQILFQIYFINSLILAIICLSSVPRKKMDRFSVYGIAIASYPACLNDLIQVSGVELPELYLMGILWIPVAILGLNLMITPGEIFFRPAVMLLMAPSAFGLIGGIFFQQTTLYPLLFLVLTVPFLRYYKLDNYMVTIRQIVFITIFFRIIVHLFVLLLQDFPTIGSCRSDKCNFFGAVLTPFGIQSNLLSMTYSFIAAFLLFFVRGRIFAISSLILLVNTDISGGRTGLLSLIFVIVCVIISKRSMDQSRRKFIYFGLIPALFLSFFPVILKHSASAFTGRGYLWEIAKNEITENPYLGVGPSFWVRLSETTSSISFYSAHNIWLELAVSTGLISASLFFIGYVSILFTVLPQRVAFTTPIIIAFLVCGAFEAPVMPYRLVQNPGFYFLLLYSTSFMHKAVISKASKNE